MSITVNNGQYATTDSVGEWEGSEELAANQFNQIIDAIAETFDDEDCEEFQRAIEWAWDMVGSDPALLDYDEDQIKSVAGRFGK